MNLFEFENKWQKDYYILALIVFIFLFPYIYINEFINDNWLKFARYALWGLFLAIILIGTIFTRVKNEDTFFTKIKNDSNFKKGIIYRMVAIAGILIFFFIFQ